MEICLQCLCLITWKCGNVEICLQGLYLITLEVWKCGNMSSMSLSNNSGSVEMSLHCLYLLTPEVWKCGEMCLHCLYPITLEVWKTGNLEMCLVCFNLITLKVWKSGKASWMILELKIGLACGEITCVTSDCCQSQDRHIASFISPPAAYFCSCLFGRKMDAPDCCGFGF